MAFVKYLNLLNWSHDVTSKAYFVKDSLQSRAGMGKEWKGGEAEGGRGGFAEGSVRKLWHWRKLRWEEDGWHKAR